MKNQIKLNAIILAAVLLVFSCAKEEFTTNTYAKKQSALTDLFKNIAPTMQNFTITAGQQQLVTGEKGTKITFYANSFKKKDGTILTSGSIKIVLQEMLTANKMILAKKSTTSNGNILRSGGQIFIKAFLGSEELIVNEASKPSVSILSTTFEPMSLYSGTVKPMDSIAGDTIINWDITKDSIVFKQDSAGGGGGGNYVGSYNFKFGNFGYWNCDQLYNDPSPKTEMYIGTPSGFVDSNTAVFIYFTSLNSVARCEGFNYTTNKFYLNHSQASVGLACKIVLVSKKDNKFYFDLKSATVTAGFNITMTPVESTEAAIKAAIDAL
jgi:hypothetical protein